VESVTSHPPPLTPVRGKRVGVGLRGERRVKRRVEAGDGREVGERFGHGVERRERLRLMQRSQVDQRAQGCLDVPVDQDGVAEALPTMHDPMSNDVRVGQAPVQRRP
jgi:hypothetical protein